jgi:hypothetical protein
MNNQPSPIGLLSVLAHSLTPGMVLDEHTYDGMIAIIQQVKASLQQDSNQAKN